MARTTTTYRQTTSSLLFSPEPAQTLSGVAYPDVPNSTARLRSIDMSARTGTAARVCQQLPIASVLKSTLPFTGQTLCPALIWVYVTYVINAQPGMFLLTGAPPQFVSHLSVRYTSDRTSSLVRQTEYIDASMILLVEQANPTVRHRLSSLQFPSITYSIPIPSFSAIQALL